jgi:AcrR family transcriptional regulator
MSAAEGSAGADQRRRLLKATTAAVAAVGYEGVDLGLILRSAGVSESRFGRNFVSKDDCCRCAFEEVCDHFDRYMTAVYVRKAPARVKVSAAAYAAARYCRDFEQQVRFGVQVHARYGNSRRAKDSLRLHLAQVDVLRREVQTSRRVAKVAPELCVGSFLGQVVRSDASGQLSELEHSIPSLLSYAFGVYFGTARANEILSGQCPSD